MPDLYKMGDVILLKQPPVGELSTIEDKLFLAAMNYMDTVRETSYFEDSTVSDERLLLVTEIIEGPNYRVCGLPLTRKTRTSKACFLENAVSVKSPADIEEVEYIAVPISINVMKEWIECRVSQISTKLAMKIINRKFQFAVGKDPRDS